MLCKTLCEKKKFRKGIEGKDTIAMPNVLTTLFTNCKGK
jgi:hypothetical protein